MAHTTHKSTFCRSLITFLVISCGLLFGRDAAANSLSCKASFVHQRAYVTTQGTATTSIVFHFFAQVDTSSGFETTYTWLFGDGTMGEGIYHGHAFPKPDTTYEVKLVVRKWDPKKAGLVSECSDTSTQTFYNGFRLAPSLCTTQIQKHVQQGNNELTIGDYFTFNPNKNVIKWEWEFGNGSTDSGRIVKHLYPKTATGDYLVKLVKTVYNADSLATTIDPPLEVLCSETVYIRVTWGMESLCTTEMLGSIGEQGQSTFTDQVPVPDSTYNVYWLWDFGDDTKGFGRFALHTYAQPGTYKVKLTKTVYYNPCHTNPATCYAQPILECIHTDSLGVNVNAILLSLYPSPASDVLNLEMQKIDTPLSFQLINQIGQVVKHAVISKEHTQIETWGLEEGLYFYSLSNERAVLEKGKIVVVR